MMQYQEAYNRLEQYGQTHLLRYYDTLSAAEQAALLQQISEMDFSVLERAAHEEAPKGKIEPLGACTISRLRKSRIPTGKLVWMPSARAVLGLFCWQAVRAAGWAVMAQKVCSGLVSTTT